MSWRGLSKRSQEKRLGKVPIRRLSRLATILLTTMLCFLMPVTIASNCDPSERGFYGYSFLLSDIVDPASAGTPYFLNFSDLYEKYGRQEVRQPADNIQEWRERYCNIPRMEDVAWIVYKASVDDMLRLRTAMSSPSIPIDVRMANNSFARYLEKNHCAETVDYLIYAKQCEPYVTTADPWNGPPRNVVAMERLIEEGLDRFLRIESHYIRLRYAYQMIRLAHYAGRYRRTLELYEYLMPKIDNDPSIIEYWIEGHRAGALLAMGQPVEAAYLYARIFQNCPSKRESAFRSFRISTDEEWRQLLLLCRDDQERSTIFAMRALAADSKAVEEMYRIYELDPASSYLETLLVREITDLEKDLLGLSFNRYRNQNKRYHNRPRAEAGKYVIEVLTFTRRVFDEGITPNRGFWKLATGYLELLAANYYEAERSFRQAARLIDDDGLEEQLDVFRLALEISSWTIPDEQVEKEAARMQSRNKLYEKYPDFQPFLTDKLIDLYQRNDRPGKAFISRYPLDYLKPNPREDIIDDLLFVCRKEDPTRLEREMIARPNGATIENDLLDMLATVYLSRFQLEAALKNLQEIDRTEWDKYGLFNPFIERINDCVHCRLPDSLQLYNKGELIERILELEYEGKADPRNAAPYFYRIGVAFYNMTYFGPSWRATDYYRSGASLRPRFLQDGQSVMPAPPYPLGNVENFDCYPALDYFERARSLTTDPELGARATFWAAKCERNIYYVYRYAGMERTHRYFDELISRYSNTRYYQRVIRECKYFRDYATK